MSQSVCVIGAGLSGLAAIRELRAGGHDVRCLERASDIGGSWRFQNDNGVSAAYASLHTNVSRRNMRYGSLRVRGRQSRRLSHRELLAYLEQYARVHGLREHIETGVRVSRVQAGEQNAGWLVWTQNGGQPLHFDAVVVATGAFWCPYFPPLEGSFAGESLHARDYREPERFRERRVVVIGGGQSALDIAAEISFAAEHTVLACRQAHNLMPERLLGVPTDYYDIDLLSRLPWPLERELVHTALVRSPLAPRRGELPDAPYTVFERRWPALATPNIERALAQRTFALAGAVQALDGDRIAFADATTEQADVVVYATGYRVSFPFLPDPLGAAGPEGFPLYRRILSPHAESLAFMGIYDCGPGRLQVAEMQGRWLAQHLAGRIPTPTPQAMWQAIDACGEPRTADRFVAAGRHTILCDRRAYERVLRTDLANATV